MEDDKKIPLDHIDNSKGIHSYLQSGTKRFIADHLDKIVWICIFFLFVFTILQVGYLSLYGIIFLLFLCLISFLFGKFQQRFAYKIIVNFTSRSVRFHMHRNKNIVEVDFDDIKSIRVNGYIIFAFNKKKIFYNDLRNSNLLKCLNKIKKIDWGSLCGLWGPEKNLREKLSGNMKNGC